MKAKAFTTRDARVLWMDGSLGCRLWPEASCERAANATELVVIQRCTTVSLCYRSGHLHPSEQVGMGEGIAQARQWID